MRLPEWMHARTTPDDRAENPRRSPRRNVTRKALAGLARLLEGMLANEEITRRPGLLQRIDPRAKVVGMIGLVVVATLVHNLAALAAAYATCLLLAVLSRVPARRLSHAWLTIPLFSAAIMLPALLNVVTPGRPLCTLWAQPTITITDAGVYVAVRFMLRTAVCVTLALLLTATTPAHRLFRGLRGLGVPVLFIMLLGMMERYLTAFLRAAEELHLAKISRSMTAGTVRQEQAWVAAGIGSLFRRTQTLGQSVYLAMISRGYTGEIHLLDAPRWRPADWAFLLITAGFATIWLALG